MGDSVEVERHITLLEEAEVGILEGECMPHRLVHGQEGVDPLAMVHPCQVVEYHIVAVTDTCYLDTPSIKPTYSVDLPCYKMFCNISMTLTQ